MLRKTRLESTASTDRARAEEARQHVLQEVAAVRDAMEDEILRARREAAQAVEALERERTAARLAFRAEQEALRREAEARWWRGRWVLKEGPEGVRRRECPHHFTSVCVPGEMFFGWRRRVGWMRE